MPFAFTQHPGQNGDQLTIARGDHRAVVTGAALILLSMITSLPYQQVGAVVTIDFPFLCWLMLGVTSLSALIAPNTTIAQYIIHVSRLGIALEHVLTNGLDTTPCSASVARIRVKRLEFNWPVLTQYLSQSSQGICTQWYCGLRQYLPPSPR